jgi:putative transposase
MTPTSLPFDALLDYVSTSDQDTRREILKHTLQAVIDEAAAAVVGAQPHERSEGRGGYRNGHRPQILDTRLGRLELAIPNCAREASCPACSRPGGGSSEPPGR